MDLTISTLREMVLKKSDLSHKSENEVTNQIQLQLSPEVVSLGAVTESKSKASPEAALSVDFSVSQDVFGAVNDFFNLGKSGRFDAFHSLSPDDKEQFVKIVAELAKSGYVGFEELLVNKKVERHEISSQIGNQRLRLARVYDNSKEHR